MKKELIRIDSLTKYYGKTKGIENLSLSLYEGEVFGFIGPNGAGKSTVIRSIMNLINKTAGTVYIDGKEFLKNDVKIKESIGYLPSEISLYEDYTVKQMLDYHQHFYKKDISPRRKELVELLKLDENKRIDDLSFGNLKKVGIILALMHSPKILILDEPTSGLDPIMQNIFYELIMKEKENGTTIIYSTHILSEVSKICDRIGIFKEGQLIKVENIEELANKNRGIVTITSKEILRIKQTLKLDDEIINDETITFVNKLSFDELIKALSKYKIDKLLIEDMNLESMFLHYYK